MGTKILITGGTGMVGMHLSEKLTKKGYEIIHLSRNPGHNTPYKTFKWDIEEEFIDLEALQVDAIIHLAGAGVADKRWSDARKEMIYSSRVESTLLLLNTLKSNNIKIKHFICASAIGYYGADTKEKVLTEETDSGSDFLANVVKDWEEASNGFKEENIPVSNVRIGIVLSSSGGALPQMIQPIKWGIGAPINSGKQMMSWIHIEDLTDIFCFLLNDETEGVFNAVAPNPVTNATMTKAIAATLKKPLFLPNVPGFVLKLMFGEMAQILIGGNNVSSNKIESLGFEFKFKEIKPALKDLIK